MSNHNNHGHNSGSAAWLKFFLGTPIRFLATLLGIGFIVSVLNPDLFEVSVQRFEMSLHPLLHDLGALILVVLGIKIIFFGHKKKGGH